LKNKSAGDGYRDKTIEKTILRAFCARTFSRSQGHLQTSAQTGGMSGLPLIVLQKSFWGVQRKFLEPLMRFARGDVRDHIG
jgi:hypothetical protein